MGADIHIFAERKLKDGTWAMCKSYESQDATVFERPQLNDDAYRILFYRVRSRNYAFFAALAGVRGDGPDPRGQPDDVSPLVAEESDVWDSDGHSHSWYSAREFVPIFVEHWLTDEERGALYAEQVERQSFTPSFVAKVLDKYLGIDIPYDDDGQQDVDAIRFVFWFDN